ncbi:MAG: hypothetical protein J6V15_01875, partial [Clostridia bacterium]|nr:hypothetical protein [Clostridia bacterium]
CFASDVRFARDKEHVTSLCAKGAIHHYGKAITSLRLAATSLFYRPEQMMRYNTLHLAGREVCQKGREISRLLS